MPLLFEVIEEEIRWNRWDRVSKIIKSGTADVNRGSLVQRTYPLHMVCSIGNIDLVRELLEAKAQINITDGEGRTPLMHACFRNHHECVTALIDAKADLETETFMGETALVHACKKGYSPVALALIKAGADINSETRKGDTALSCASTAGHVDKVMGMLAQEAAGSGQQSSSSRALRIACMNGCTALTIALLEEWVDAIDQQTLADALTLACGSGHLDCADVLLTYVDANATNGNTALALAYNGGHIDTRGCCWWTRWTSMLPT